MSDSEAADEAVVLRYTAKGDRYIPGVPARDLNSRDITRLSHSGRLGKTRPTVIKRLVEAGQYEAVSDRADDSKAEEA